MNLRITHDDLELTADLGHPIDIGLALKFSGPQPNFFAAEPATAEPVYTDGFVGDTAAGGSCNVARCHLTPHCNGTHTECIGHIVSEHLTVRNLVPPGLRLASLASVEPEYALQTEDSVPATDARERVVSRRALDAALDAREYPCQRALIIRTLPNDSNKRARRYEDNASYPYFTPEAIDRMLQWGVEDLLVDTPSLERADDGGLMAAHRRFWGVSPNAVRLGGDEPSSRSVTELCHIDDTVADGDYLLELQIAPFELDAAPSRPVLYPVSAISRESSDR